MEFEMHPLYDSLRQFAEDMTAAFRVMAEAWQSAVMDELRPLVDMWRGMNQDVRFRAAFMDVAAFERQYAMQRTRKRRRDRRRP